MRKPAYARNEFSQCTWNFCVGAGDSDKSQTIFRVFRRIRLKMVYTRRGKSDGNEGEGGAGGEAHPRYETGTREFMNTSRNLCGYTLE